MSSRRGAGVILAIALFKLIKAALLVGLGVGAFKLVFEGDTVLALRHFLNALGIDASRPLLIRGIAKISGISHRRLEEVGVGTIAYAIVFSIEGIGLLLRRRWAEYLTVIVTGSFVPFEVYELVHKASVLKAIGLVVNVLIVAYFAFRLWRERRAA